MNGNSIRATGRCRSIATRQWVSELRGSWATACQICLATVIVVLASAGSTRAEEAKLRIDNNTGSRVHVRIRSVQMPANQYDFTREFPGEYDADDAKYTATLKSPDRFIVEMTLPEENNKKVTSLAMPLKKVLAIAPSYTLRLSRIAAGEVKPADDRFYFDLDSNELSPEERQKVETLLGEEDKKLLSQEVAPTRETAPLRRFFRRRR